MAAMMFLNGKNVKKLCNSEFGFKNGRHLYKATREIFHKVYVLLSRA